MMLEPDREQPRPTSVEISALWATEVFRGRATVGPAVSAVVDELRRARSGDIEAFFTSADFPKDPVLHWFVSRDRFDEVGFVENYVASSAFRAAAPGVWDPGAKPFKGWRHASWWIGNPLVLDGEIAAALVGAGCGDQVRAKALGEAFARELIQDRYSELMILADKTPWSDWFNETPWDATWVGVDKRNCRVWALVVTAPWP